MPLEQTIPDCVLGGGHGKRRLQPTEHCADAASWSPTIIFERSFRSAPAYNYSSVVSHPLHGRFNDPVGRWFKTPRMASPDSVLRQRVSRADVQMRVGCLEQNGIIMTADGFPTPHNNVLLQGRPCFAVAQNQSDVLFQGGANHSTPDGFQAFAKNFPFRCLLAVVPQMDFVQLKGFAVLGDVPTHA